MNKDRIRYTLLEQRRFVLTARQETILKHLANMDSVDDIANLMFLSRSTIKGDVLALYRALGVKSRGPAVAKAYHLGVLFPAWFDWED